MKHAMNTVCIKNLTYLWNWEVHDRDINLRYVHEV